jgi:nucleotide-binding universal stress UspA family protein
MADLDRDHTRPASPEGWWVHGLSGSVPYRKTDPMTFKTIMVHAGVDPAAPARIRAALALGRRYQAAVLGVGAIAWDPYIDPTLGYADGETLQALRDDVALDMVAAETGFRTLCADYPHPVIWRPVDGYPGRAMSALARCADVIVATHPQKNFDSRRFPPPVDLVMESGLPVILLAPGQETVELREVVVGWKNTRETRRAVSDALPLLKLADRVHVVQVCENDAVDAALPEMEDVVARLLRHGVRAAFSTSPQMRGSVAEDVMDLADSRMADLVVLGAYGHSRLREWSFGGVTSDLLAGCHKTLLFSR